MIVDGAVEVTRGGRHLNDVQPIGGVGEIALLHRVPRTATVVARGHVQTLAVDGADFLAAVTGHARSLEAALKLSAPAGAGSRGDGRGSPLSGGADDDDVGEAAAAGERTAMRVGPAG